MTEARIADLRSRYAGRLLTAPDEVAPFVEDWRKHWRGRAWAVAQPGSTEEVAAIVRWCAERRIPVAPQGGNTGLSGGSVPDTSGEALVLSLRRLDRIRAIDPLNNTMTVGAGCVLATIQAAAESADRLFPLSLAAEGSCTIGGNLATNAGGTGVLRYGNARDLCLGLEVVTAQGEIWDGLRGLRKDNTGYDLRDLFVGSEGTLGVITAAVLKLFPRPRGKGVAILAVDTPQAAMDAFSHVRGRLDTALTAFEIFSARCLGLVLKHVPACRAPLATQGAWYVLVEVSDLESEQRAREMLEGALLPVLESGMIADAAIAESLGQARAFWRLREEISEAQAAAGPNIKHDISLPISALADFMTDVGDALESRWPVASLVAFGHVGDGNLHFNVALPKGFENTQVLQRDINAFVHDHVAARGGSISAEHGLGVLRRDEAARYKSPVEMGLLRTLKNALDPLGIMNKGKVLAD